MEDGTMQIGTALLAIFFAFIIGGIFGGMALFISRGMLINRQLRIAQKKATKLLAEAGNNRVTPVSSVPSILSRRTSLAKNSASGRNTAAAAV